VTTPGGGFEYSSDGESVVAKLSIDIPQEGLQSLREMTTETNRYRVELEAANRMGKDFVEYLRQLPQIQAQVAQAQKEIVEQLQRTIDVQKQMLQPGGAGNGSYQTGTAEIASAQSSRAPTLSDTAAAFGNKDGRTLLRAESVSSTRAGLTAINPHEDAITQADSRAALRKAAQESQQAKSDPGGKPKSPPIDHEEKGVGYDELRSQISGSTGPLSAILNELQAGGGGGGAGSLLSLLGKTVGGAGGEGGILSSLGMGGAAGPVAAGLAAAGAGMWAFQEGGQMLEGYRQMGQARGGGLGEGMGYEMAIRSMALNPFLSTDQARKIVQQGLSEGYTGKEFDTATQFVAENLKSMNIDISTSFSLMKKNILEGGMTVPGVQASIQDLASISAQGGYRSVPDLVAGYTGTSQALLAAGVPAAVADRTAKESAVMFNDSPINAGQGDEIAQAAASNPEILYLGARLTGQQITPGSLPNTMAEQLPNGGRDAVWAVIKQRAQLASQGARNKQQAVGKFQYMLQAMPGLNKLKAASDIRAAEDLFNRAMGGGDPIADAQKANEQATQENMSVRSRSLNEQHRSQMGGLAMTLAKGAWDVGKDIFTGNWGDIFSQESQQKEEDTFANEMYGASANYIPRMDALVNAYGVHGVEVVDESGKASGFNPDNRDQLDAISSGKYKVQVKGGSPFPLAELPSQTGDDLKKTLQENYGMPNSGGNNNVSVQGSVQINVNPPEMAKALGISQGQSIQLSPNKVQAMQGWGNGQTNQPVPGF